MSSTVLVVSRRVIPAAATNRTTTVKRTLGGFSSQLLQQQQQPYSLPQPRHQFQRQPQEQQFIGPLQFQRRHYFYIPTSWAECQERFARWSESVEQRTIRVQLLKEQQLLLEKKQQQQERQQQLLLLQQAQDLQLQRYRTAKWARQRAKRVFGSSSSASSRRQQGIRPSLRQRRFQHQQRQEALAAAAAAAATWTTTPLPAASLSSSSPTSSVLVDLVVPIPPSIRLRDRMRKWTNQQLQSVLHGSSGSTGGTMLRDRYQGWKSKQRARYQGWKSRRQEQWSDFQLSKLKQQQRSIFPNANTNASTLVPRSRILMSNLPRRLALASRRTQHKIRATVSHQLHRMIWRTKNITLTEYSKPEWFDALGRPLTSRDETGRFVNPWQSQSTNGVQSLSTILAWRYLRISRNLEQWGIFRSLIPKLSWTEQDYIPPTATEVWTATATTPRSSSSSTPSTLTNKSPNGSTTTSSSGSSTPLRQDRVPPLPLLHDDDDDMMNNDIQLTWIGHCTCWVQLGGFSVLTDPMFSLRASPYQYLPIGAPREIPPAHSIGDLLDHYKQLNAPKIGGKNWDDSSWSRTSEDDDEEEEDQQHQPHNSNTSTASIPKMDVCCITHDHYDHMDKDSVLALRDHVSVWVVPLGIKEWLVELCDISSESVVELEWWEQAHLIKTTTSEHNSGIPKTVIQVQVEDSLDDTTSRFGMDDEPRSEYHQEQRRLTVTCCPAQHWSSRTLFDRNTRLWCSFALHDTTHSWKDARSTSAAAPTDDDSNNRVGAKFFFCGDTGYPTFPLFRQIGDALGPFDLAAIPIGAYKPESMMKEAHLDPAEALQVHFELQSKHSVGIHWGTFALSEEDMDEPPQRLREALQSEFGRLMQKHTDDQQRERQEMAPLALDMDTDDPIYNGKIVEEEQQSLQRLPSLPSLDFATLEHGETIRVSVQGTGTTTTTRASRMRQDEEERSSHDGTLAEEGTYHAYESKAL